MKAYFAAALLAACTLAADQDKKAMVGTNIGGWMVLEPWITPSPFYRFLGKTHSEGVAIDSSTLCEVLGVEEGNKLLRAHWDAWVTEEHIKQLADREVEIVRLPIGDWIIQPYGPYDGCYDGATDKVEWFLDTAAQHNIKVLLDVHGVKDSQNGFDNSGMANRVTWTDEDHFLHAPVVGEWMGTWNEDKKRYDRFNWDNMNFAVKTIDLILDKWGTHPALHAIEPVNEPWWRSDGDVLKRFYRQVRALMKERAPHLKFVFHDAFRPLGFGWDDLFEDDDHENVVMDTHQYMMMFPNLGNRLVYEEAYKVLVAGAGRVKYEVWVGEWSLATDMCGMWLGGFNDCAGILHKQHECQWVECPHSYLPDEFAVDFDRTADKLGPFGGCEDSGVRKGQCPIDSAQFSEDEVHRLARSTLHIFNEHVEGQFLWNFRNELEPRWNYVTAYDKGWLKQDSSDENQVFEEEVLLQ